LQVLGEPHLKAKDFEHQVRSFQQGLALPGVFRLDQSLQQVVEVAFDAFAQHEAVIAGEFARVVAAPQDQVIGLGDDGQFICSSAVGHKRSLPSKCYADRPGLVYHDLARWCLTRTRQLIVCGDAAHAWMPFSPLGHRTKSAGTRVAANFRHSGNMKKARREIKSERLAGARARQTFCQNTGRFLATLPQRSESWKFSTARWWHVACDNGQRQPPWACPGWRVASVQAVADDTRGPWQA
jgi:hypothetical protein